MQIESTSIAVGTIISPPLTVVTEKLRKAAFKKAGRYGGFPCMTRFMNAGDDTIAVLCIPKSRKTYGGTHSYRPEGGSAIKPKRFGLDNTYIVSEYDGSDLRAQKLAPANSIARLTGVNFTLDHVYIAMEPVTRYTFDDRNPDANVRLCR